MTTTVTPGSGVAPHSAAPVRPGAALGRRTTAVIFVAPLVLTIVCVAMCVPSAGRRFYDWLISENKPVEMATFALALVAAVMAARFGVALIRRRQRLAGAFYFLFALGMFFIGMEEISWGQQVFGWETPADWGTKNAQNETTLHNLGPFQGHNDILRFAFGFGGLIGVLMAPLLPRLRVLFPHRVLILWFLCIAGVSAAQMYVDLTPDGPLTGPLKRLGRLAEVIELYISIAAVLYLWINLRLVRPPDASPA